MAFTVSDVINDAFDRTGIFPNPQDSLPGDMFEMGHKLLRGLCDGYNIRNMILSSQRKCTTTVPANGIIVAQKTAGGDFKDDVASIQKVLIKVSNNQAGELEFVPYQDFDIYPNGAMVYTYNQTTENTFEIEVKQNMVGKEAIVLYNAPFPCEKTTTYYIPNEYRELFILGLGVKLLSVYPRQDGKMEESFKEQLGSIMHSITAKQSESKLIMENSYGKRSLRTRGDSGAFLMGW